jgi:methylmalonyl-CoA carboxyltransferase large subunit
MARVTVTELSATVEELRAQIAELSKRLESLAGPKGGAHGAYGAAAAAPVVAAEPARGTITEEELLAISAAIGAYLGVRAHIRQIRLLSTNAWAQQGRVSIQASHMLQG